jgi:hypothetical protein
MIDRLALCALAAALLFASACGTAVADTNCYGSSAARGEASVPSGKIDPESVPAHEAAVFRDGHVIGWIYQLPDGSLWVETGASAADAAFLMALTGAQSAFAGANTQVELQYKRLSLAALSGKSITLTSCF